MPSNHFSETVAEKLQHYVYRLIDPRTGMTFYVGRGQGDRVFSHAAGQQEPTMDEDDLALKAKTIRDIRNAGFEVQHIIHRHGMTEAVAREVEAALIEAYQGLTNLQGGYDGSRGVMHAEEVIRLYEAEEAVFHHKVMLITVNRSSEERELYEAVRYAWPVSVERARECEFVLAVRRGIIIGAFEPSKWLEATASNFPMYGDRAGRYGFVGKEASREIWNLYAQKRVPARYRRRGAAFPIRYVGPDESF
jgi:hypothetical protein